MSLRELYQEIIIDHGRHPRHTGKLDNATHSHAGHNPLCGDQLMLYIVVSQGVIEDLRFEGTGCAISVASTSLMMEAVKGKSLADVQHLFDDFHILLTEGKEPETGMGKLAAFSGVAEFPARVKCATLAWHTLMAALANNPDPVSTE